MYGKGKMSRGIDVSNCPIASNFIRDRINKPQNDLVQSNKLSHWSFEGRPALYTFFCFVSVEGGGYN